jgi:hypothetical protein
VPSAFGHGEGGDLGVVKLRFIVVEEQDIVGGSTMPSETSEMVAKS